MSKITGRVSINVNGKNLLNKSGAVASGISRTDGKPAFKREAVMGDSGVHGFTETPIVAQVAVTITDVDKYADGSKAKLGDFWAIGEGNDSVKFMAEGGSGKTLILLNPFYVGDSSLTAGQGEVSLTFQGTGWQEDIP